MADELPESLLLVDPLGEETRKERRFLLALSLISIVIVKTGLMPTKISALGVEFTPSDQVTILWVMIFLIVYALGAFVIYGFSDFVKWQASQRLVAKKAFSERSTLEDLLEKEAEKIIATLLEKEPELISQLAQQYRQDPSKIRVWAKETSSQFSEDVIKLLKPMFVEKYSLTALSKVSWLRVGFDFFLPMVVSAYAIYCLWSVKLPVT